MRNLIAIPCVVAFITTTLSVGNTQEVDKSSLVRGRISSIIKATPSGKAVFTSTPKSNFFVGKGTLERITPNAASARDAIRTNTPPPHWVQTHDIEHMGTIPLVDYW